MKFSIERIRHLAAFLLPAFACLVPGWLLLKEESDVLFRMSELNLFLDTRLFFDTLNIYPGGTLSWMACWCAEWLHYPALGVGLLVLMWMLIIAMVCYLGRLKGSWTTLASATPILLAGIIAQTGYWIYYQKMEGYLFAPTIGILFSLSAACVGRLLPERWGGIFRLAWMLLWGTWGYILLGAWSFVGTLLLAWPKNGRFWTLRQLLPLALSILLILLFPKIACQHIYSQVEQSEIYRAAMPTFAVNDKSFQVYRWPYLLAVFSLFPALLNILSERLKKRQAMGYILGILIICGAAWETSHIWFRDTNFHKEVRMHTAIEKMDWEKVLHIAREKSEAPPTRLLVWYKNLALFRLGRAGDELFHFPEGDTMQNAPWMVHISQVGGKMLYYQFGRANFCYRWCMEDGVEYGWTVYNLQLMVKASLLSGDWEVAEKYLNLLEHTRFYKDWAQQYRAFLRHPERVKEDPEMGFIQHLMPSKSHLDADNTKVEVYLLDSFAKGKGTDPLFQEMSLLCAMLGRDIPTFWPHFFQYCQMHSGEHIPTHYQEAAYLYGMLEHQVDVNQMPFDESVRKSYADFMQFNAQCGNMTQEQKRVAFRPQFGNTFYYYYFLIRNLKTN